MMTELEKSVELRMERKTASKGKDKYGEGWAWIVMQDKTLASMTECKAKTIR